MRQNKWLPIILVLALLLFCVGCRGQGDTGDETTPEVTVSPEDINCIDLVQSVVTETELVAFLDTWPSVYELNQKYPVECFRRTVVPVWGEQIWATYCTDQGWIIVYFSDKMKYSSHNSFQMKSSMEALGQVKIGMSVDEVEELDPAGDYWFRYSNQPWVSYHYMEDGTEYYIAYDGYFNVIEICKVLI